MIGNSRWLVIAKWKGNEALTNKDKKTRISVNKDELDVASLEQFNFMAKAYQIPRGKFLSRGLYLAAREVGGEISTDYDMESKQKRLRAEGLVVDRDILLDTKSWLELVK